MKKFWLITFVYREGQRFEYVSFVYDVSPVKALLDERKGVEERRPNQFTEVNIISCVEIDEETYNKGADEL